MNLIAEKIKEQRIQQHKIEDEISKLAKPVIPEYISMFHTIGTWECNKSPIGLCVYNHMEDRCLDDCLYCHHPDERK